MRKLIKRVLSTLVLGFASLFIVIIISFFISKIIPGDPILAYLPIHYTQEQYAAVSHMLGLDQHVIVQIFRYISNMLAGNWGISLGVYTGHSVFDLIMERLPLTLFLLLLPLFLGLVLGFILGNYSMKLNSKKGVRTVQIFSFMGFGIPIVVLNFINSISVLMILWIPLTISIISLTILLVRIYLNNRSKEASEKRSNIPFILLVGVSYGIIFLFLMQTELLFSFEGLGGLLLQAFSSADYYVINAIIFLMLFSAPIFIIFSLFSFFLFGKVKKK